MKLAIFYGSTTGNVEMAAEMIQEQLGDMVSHFADVANSEPKELEEYDVLLLGLSTWNIGEMQDDWADFIPKMDGLSLKGKKIAMFGQGDAVGYPDNYLDAFGELWDKLKECGADPLIGLWPIDEYEFNESQGLTEDGKHFLGLGLDEDNEPDLTEERIQRWLVQVLQEIGIELPSS
ncbi:Flavodoxin FldA [Planctomycetales bacterium 10988]|nr:Flavodoxin FldA [Planctomycetales bacterium 10988]